MRSLGIITDSINVTVMGVGHTLVNIYEEKLPGKFFDQKQAENRKT